VLIREVMTESVVTAAPERTVREIAELMRERNVGSVVLVDDNAVVDAQAGRDCQLGVRRDAHAHDDRLRLDEADAVETYARDPPAAAILTTSEALVSPSGITALAEPSSGVYPSGEALVTSSLPMLPPAPARFFIQDH